VTHHAGDAVDRRVRAGVLLLVAAAVLWSTNGLLIKLLHGELGQGGLTIAGYRSLVAAIALAPLAYRRRRPIANAKWVAATVVAFTFMCTTFVLATTLTSAANAIILQYTAPAWVFVLSPILLGERSTRSQWVSLVLSMIGVGVIFVSQISRDPVGLSVGLASGLVFGVQSVLFRKVRDVDPAMLVWLTCSGSAALLVPAAATIEGFTLTPVAAACLVGMGVVQFALPYVLYSAGVARVTAQKAVLVVLLEPVLNPVWVWLVLSERPAASTIVGGVLILVAVAFVTVVETRAMRRRSGALAVSGAASQMRDER
jgi:drug/metabolite transporter (DMT)-like permease